MLGLWDRWRETLHAATNVAIAFVDKEDLDNHSCAPLGDIRAVYDYFSTDSANSVISYRWYLSNDFDTNGSTDTANSSSSFGEMVMESEDSRISVGAVIGIVLAGIVLVAATVVFICCRHRFKGKWFSSPRSRDTASLEAAVSGQRELWNDDIITTRRIPRHKLKIKNLISRGAFGEVYVGIFNRQRVAIKMLLPSIRTNLQHVNTFLAEAKITAIMEHPHIIQFVGVAWDSLSDLCVVLEFMDGGDLRTLLSKYEVSNHPIGFDYEKVTIALHVCHALTYLHSFSQPMIHRDLKSRNVLLNSAMEAKLTDFGISRERVDRTMTAGVRTSLWMAPGVMLGERYDDKADMFSFAWCYQSCSHIRFLIVIAKSDGVRPKDTNWPTQLYFKWSQQGTHALSFRIQSVFNHETWSFLRVTGPERKA